MRSLLAAVAALASLAAVSGDAQAEPYGNRRVVQVPQGVGCYWYRGELNCSRYCYWEIDGYRYCTRRLRNAHSQAPDVFVGEAYPSRRYRPVK